MPELTLEFGSRSGSWFALALFGAIFAVLGLLVMRTIRRRASGASPWVAPLAGTLVVLAPLVLIWMTSLNGFYEAELSNGAVRLRYLSGMSEELRAAEISTVTATPWYRGRWRMRIVETNGTRHESATWDREAVGQAVARLTTAIERARGEGR